MVQLRCQRGVLPVTVAQQALAVKWLAQPAGSYNWNPHFNYYPSATLYGVYGTFVIYGLIAWRKLVRAQYVRRSARPQRKSVEAHPGWVVGQE